MQATAPARILVVEDDDDSRALLAELLARDGHDVRTAPDADAALAEIAREAPEVVVSDVVMPGGGGFEVVRRLRADPALASIPVILVSALDAATRKVAGLDLGADDYVAKPVDVAELLARVRTQLRRAAQYRALDRSARVDPLTGVMNRRGILELLQRELRAASAGGAPVSVALVDVDRFKHVNDHFGHAAGDTVLRLVAHALVANARAADDVGRLGGDELVLVLPGSDEVGAALVASRLRQVRVPIEAPGDGEVVTLSVGAATRRPGEGADALLARADHAMYLDKQGRVGGGR
jgi:diguanylate cyclase (GGDEF)-like protein